MRIESDSAAGDPADLLGLAVGRAQRGDAGAFTTVYRTVQPVLLRYLSTLVGQDAQDVASEAWLQITRDLGSFHGDGDAFRGWAATVARNRALDHLRAAKRRPRASDYALDPDAAGPAGLDPESCLLDSQATAAAVRMISALPKEQAEALMLRVVMDLDVETAARVLGKRPGAVRVATHRALRTLASQLQTTDRATRPARLRRTGEPLHLS